MTINPEQYHIESWPAGRKTSGVRVTHTPTGIHSTSMTKRSVHENKYSAIKKLEILVNEHYEGDRDE